MAQQLPGPETRTPPVRRKTPLILLLMIAASLSAVLGTVLLSRDMQHLRALTAYLGWDILPPRKVETAQPQAKPAPPVKKPVSQVINTRLFRPVVPETATAFRRTWQMSGPDMCSELRNNGIPVSEWQKAAISQTTFECSYEKIYRPEGEKGPSSLFLIVRGDQKDTISSMRVKLVDPLRDKSGGLDPQVLKIFETMLTQSRWGDFSAELEAIRTLKDVKKDGFGASMRFTREFDNQDRYNFILTLQALTPEQKRSNDYLLPETGFQAARPAFDPALFQAGCVPPGIDPGFEGAAPAKASGSPCPLGLQPAAPAAPSDKEYLPVPPREQQGVPVDADGKPLVGAPVPTGDLPLYQEKVREEKQARPGVRTPYERNR